MANETDCKTPADPDDLSSHVPDPVFWFAQFSAAVEKNRLDDAARAIEQLNRRGMMISWDEEQSMWALKPI